MDESTAPEAEVVPETESRVKLRGFAAMDPERRKALARKGAQIAHERGTANKFDSDTASAAGRIPHAKGTAHHWSSEEASDAAKKGAGVRRRKRTQKPPPPTGEA